MKCKTNIISLDLETTGITPGKHVPISIGAVRLDADLDGHVSTNSFYVQLEWDFLIVDPAAMKINGLDIANPPGRDGAFDKKSLPAHEGLNAFSEWINPPGKIITEFPIPDIIALGKNVGSFDLPMLKAVWDHGLKRPWPFGYRAIDLNTMFFALSEIVNKPFDVVKKEVERAAWYKINDAENLPVHDEHHALTDAWWNVYAWKHCLEWLKDLGR